MGLGLTGPATYYTASGAIDTQAALSWLLGIVFVWFGAWLPPLVDDTRFTTLNLVWTAALAIVFAMGTGLALYRGVRNRQPVLQYVAVMAAVLAVRLGDDVLGGQLYDTVWYLNRVLVVAAFSAMLVGILEDHLALLRRERAASALARERAAELEATLDSMSDAVLVLDARAVVVDANAAALELLGLGSKEQARRPIAEHRDRLQLSNLDPSRPIEPLPGMRALQGETVRGFLCRASDASARVRLMEINASPVRDAGGVRGAVLVIRDVTELQWARSRASVARVATAVASTHTPADLVQSVLSETREVLGADIVMLHELDPSGRLVFRGQHGGSADFAELSAKMEVGLESNTLTAGAVRLRTVQVLPNVREAPTEYARTRALGERFGFQGAVAVPLVVREGALGALLCLYAAPRRLSPQEVETVTTIGGIVAVGLANVRLYEQAEDERQRLLAVIEHSPEGILLFEPQAGRLVLANPASRALLGVPVDFNIPISDHPAAYGLARSDGSPYPAAELPSARALAGEVVLGEEFLLQAGGRPGRPVLVNAAPVRDHAGQITGAVVVMHDISRIKALERQREEFVSVIAHDLRTPIGVIQNYAEVLHRAAQSRGDSENEIRAATAIGLSARRLDGMVNDLLDASRIEAERLGLSLSAVDLPALAKSLVERLGPMLGAHAVQLFVAHDVSAVMADPSRVEQILTNLLTNAAKYSPDGAEISLSIETDGVAALVSVGDHGPGIPPDEKAVLFERFYRARSVRAGKEEGLGLGLYICRGLVAAHGGRMWVDSAPGKGSAFRFTLPLARRPDSVTA